MNVKIFYLLTLYVRKTEFKEIMSLEPRFLMPNTVLYALQQTATN